MSQYGPINFSFRDPKVLHWAALALGLSLLLAAAIVGLMFLLEPPRHTNDFVGALVLLGVLLVGGVSSTAYAIFNIAAPAEWHVTASHVFRARGERIVRSIAFRGTPAPNLTQIVRYGEVISVRVQFKGAYLMVPTLDVARAIQASWKAQNT